MPAPRRIYLDNAATSFPKPPGVYESMLRYGVEIGASPGRGHYAESREGARLVRRCRERLNTLFNGESADAIVFTLNTSDALNLAIKGVVRARRLAHPGRRISLVTTAMDHNSVLRPYSALADEGVEWILVEADHATGLVDPATVDAAIDADTALVAVNMASNVTGTIQPVTAIGVVCRRRRVLYLVDAAQSAGHVPVDVRAVGCDLLAFPGHKGLLGPQGTGGLYIRPGVEPLVATVREGGTGSMSEVDAQPTTMPERYEAGSHNTIGIVGLSEGVRYLLDRTVDDVRLHEVALIRIMLAGVRAAGCRTAGDAPADAGPLAALRLLGPTEPEARVGTFSFVHDVLGAAEIAAMLETGFGILARAGLHCAPHAHRTVGSLAGGAVRLSFGPFVTEADVHAAVDALTQVCASDAELPRLAGAVRP